MFKQAMASPGELVDLSGDGSFSVRTLVRLGKRLGSLLCARRTLLLAWIEEQETRGRQGLPSGQP